MMKSIQRLKEALNQIKTEKESYEAVIMAASVNKTELLKQFNETFASFNELIIKTRQEVTQDQENNQGQEQ